MGHHFLICAWQWSAITPITQKITKKRAKNTITSSFQKVAGCYSCHPLFIKQAGYWGISKFQTWISGPNRITRRKPGALPIHGFYKAGQFIAYKFWQVAVIRALTTLFRCANELCKAPIQEKIGRNFESAYLIKTRRNFQKKGLKSQNNDWTKGKSKYG